MATVRKIKTGTTTPKRDKTTASRPKKRALIFSMTYQPFVGGAEVAVREITDRVSKDEIEFHMITLRFDSALPEVEQIGNVLVHRIGFARPHPSPEGLKQFPLHLNKLYYQVAAALRASLLHRKYHYDATWAIMAHSAGVPAALFKMSHPQVPYLLTLQEGDPVEHIKRVMLPLYPLFVRAFKRADQLQAISTHLASWGTAMGFHGKPVVIPNGVDINRFSKEYPRRELEELKQKLDKKVNSIFLVTTSRLVEKNGIDTVIHALVKLPPQVSFLVLGEGPEEERLKALARNLGVMSRVRFLGHVPQKEIPKYLKVSEIFIRPSRSEGMGNSFIEAMASGTPVIATQVGGITDFIFDPDRNPDVKPTGLAVDVDDSAAVAEQVLRYSSDVLLRREITDNAHALVEARYDWKLIVRAMHEKVFTPLFSKTTARK
ncbi:MAG: glycosyltransferase [Candidatus Pacebacteria bacterium]|nr:glycosyltransferase [Candidatus Paceibacterota bacterium]